MAKKDKEGAAQREERQRDEILHRLLKTPPEQRPKREREDEPAKRKGGGKSGRSS